MDHYLERFRPSRSRKDNRTLLHRSKRALQRLGIRISRAFSGYQLSSYVDGEREAASIFRQMIKDPENDLLTSPLSGKYYLRSDRRHMLLVLGNRTLNIVNHVYGYTVPLSIKTDTQLQLLFLREVEKRRQDMENEFASNVRHSLKTIAEKLRKGE